MRQTRKQRAVKNGLVAIDDVPEDPGSNFTNWINAARRKLKQREHVMLLERITVCNEIISKAIDQFITELPVRNQHETKLKELYYHLKKRYNECIKPQLTPHANIMHQTVTLLNDKLSSWKGCNIKSNKLQTVGTWRQYWRKSKNWFDQTKIHLICSCFWTPILILIERYVSSTAQTEHYKVLHLLILTNIFAAKVKFANTKPQYLMAIGIYKKCSYIHKLAGIDDTYFNQDEEDLDCKEPTEVRLILLNEINKSLENARNNLRDNVKLEIKIEYEKLDDFDTNMTKKEDNNVIVHSDDPDGDDESDDFLEASCDNAPVSVFPIQLIPPYLICDPTGLSGIFSPIININHAHFKFFNINNNPLITFTQLLPF